MLDARARVDADDGERRDVRRHAAREHPHRQQQRGGDGEAPGQPPAEHRPGSGLPAAQRRAGRGAALDEREIVQTHAPCHRPLGRGAQPGQRMCDNARICTPSARPRRPHRSRGTSTTASSAIRQDIFERPCCAVAERDRDLDHAEARLRGAVGELDLEHVAVGARLGEVDRLQHLAAEALEAAGQVLDAQARGRPRRTSEPPRLIARRTRPQSRTPPPARSASRARGRRPARRRRAAARCPPGRGRSRRPSRGRALGAAAQRERRSRPGTRGRGPRARCGAGPRRRGARRRGASAIRPVPSGEPSSTTRILCAPGAARSSTARRPAPRARRSRPPRRSGG